jgi:hypothetical protein
MPQYSTTLAFEVPFVAIDPDPGSGIAKVEVYYRIDEVPGSGDYIDHLGASPMPFTAPRDGKYEFGTMATDNALNLETDLSEPMGVVIVDTARPYASAVTLSRAGPYNSDVDVDIRFNEAVNASSLAVTFGATAPYDRYTVEGEMDGADLWHGTLPIDMDTSSGTYTISIAGGSDIAGNLLISNTDTTFDVDTTPPVIKSLIFDRHEPVDLGTVNFTVRFSEDMDINVPLSFVLELNGSTYQVDGTWSSKRIWKGSFEVIGTMENGLYTIKIDGGADILGNQMLEDTTYIIDIKVTGPEPPPPPEPTPTSNIEGVVWWIIAGILAVIATIMIIFLIVLWRRKDKDA